MVTEEPGVEGQRGGGRRDTIGSYETKREGHAVSNKPESKRWAEHRGCDLQTQWSERFRLETMRTFPAAFEMGIAQHTTRGEDRPLLPLLSPIGGWRRGVGVWRGGGGGEEDDLSLGW